MLEGFCFASFFFCVFIHVVTLCMFPSVGWVKYEVLFFAVYAIFGTDLTHPTDGNMQRVTT
jgi:hypothetical protein